MPPPVAAATPAMHLARRGHAGHATMVDFCGNGSRHERLSCT
jgi:hypothetical protein